MKLLTALLVTCLCTALSYQARSQQPVNEDSLQKVQADAFQRSLLKDSLGLSDQTVNLVFALRDSSFARAGRIRVNGALTPGQQNVALMTLRSETADAMSTAMGAANYVRYLELIVGRKPD